MYCENVKMLTFKSTTKCFFKNKLFMKSDKEIEEEKKVTIYNSQKAHWSQSNQ